MIVTLINGILGMIVPGFKTTKNKLIVFLLLLILIIFNIFLFKNLMDSRARVQRQTQNITNLTNNFDKQIKIEQLKNGQLKHSIGSLTIEASEFKNVNSTLNDELKELKLKVKNLKSVTDFSTRTVYKVDTIETIKYFAIDDKINPNANIVKPIVNDTVVTEVKLDVYKFKNKDEFIDLKGDVVIDKTAENPQPVITNLNLEVKDSLIIAPEFQKKRVWLFFKKKVGVKLNIISKSPYTKIDYMKHYNFEDYRK